MMRPFPKKECGTCNQPIASKKWIRVIVDVRTKGAFGFKTTATAFAVPFDSVDHLKIGLMKFLEDDFTPLEQELKS